tara:strand:+ start:1500 stop:1715 length:216 start_codon:yes stop_codon:yes gene_type:complete
MLGLEALEGEFVIRDNDEIIKLSRVRDIPPSFDHLISFKPTPPEPPHTVNDHLEMAKYAEYLQELMTRETK